MIRMALGRERDTENNSQESKAMSKNLFGNEVETAEYQTWRIEKMWNVEASSVKKCPNVLGKSA